MFLTWCLWTEFRGLWTWIGNHFTFIFTDLWLKFSISFNYRCRQQTKVVHISSSSDLIANRKYRSFYIIFLLIGGVSKYRLCIYHYYRYIVVIRPTAKTCYINLMLVYFEIILITVFFNIIGFCWNFILHIYKYYFEKGSIDLTILPKGIRYKKMDKNASSGSFLGSFHLKISLFLSFSYFSKMNYFSYRSSHLIIFYIHISFLPYSWLHWNPLSVHHIQGLWNHVPCFYHAAIHT